MRKKTTTEGQTGLSDRLAPATWADQSRPTRRWWWLLFCLVAVTVGCALNPAAQSDTVASAGNGYPVAAEFQAFFDEHGGLRVFGYPIGDIYFDELSGRRIQYFQRLRLEYDPRTENVTLTSLGEWAVPELADQILAPGARGRGEDSRHENTMVQDEFLEFYQEFGGSSFFGSPRSPQLNEGGRRVQYFENASLVWHPESPVDHRVQLGLLGEAHYRHVGIFEDPGRSRPLDSAAVREAVVVANVRAPILYGGEDQVVYVYVETPDDRRPVAGAQVNVAFEYDGKEVVKDLRLTDSDGQTSIEMSFNQASPGQRVRIRITAQAPGGDTIGQTSQAFKLWW